MKVIHVISGLDKAHGGPSYSVPRLVQELQSNSVAAKIFCDRDSSLQALADPHLVEFFPRDYDKIPLLRKIHFSCSLARALGEQSERNTIIHSHGLWRMSNIYAARSVKDREGFYHVVSPRGMLGEPALEFSQYQKKLFWFFRQHSALKECACFHATSEQEYEEIRRAGFLNPVAVIPNGVDIPQLKPRKPTDSDNSKKRTLLFLSRLHGKKNLEGLLSAWAILHSKHPYWQLDIVGSGEPSYVEALQRWVLVSGLPRVIFHGPSYESEKWDRFRNADLFVLPTLNENFGIVVAESLACETPVIVTRGAPWAGLDKHRCGWWIDFGEDALVKSLHNAMSLPNNVLHEMGARGKLWIRSDFAWDSIALEMIAVYEWLIGCGDLPKSVIVR